MCESVPAPHLRVRFVCAAGRVVCFRSQMTCLSAFTYLPNVPTPLDRELRKSPANPLTNLHEQTLVKSTLERFKPVRIALSRYEKRRHAHSLSSLFQLKTKGRFAHFRLDEYDDVREHRCMICDKCNPSKPAPSPIDLSQHRCAWCAWQALSVARLRAGTGHRA